MRFTCGVITVNDSCFNKTAEDKSGPALIAEVEKNFFGLTAIFRIMVPDDQNQIVASLQSLCSQNVNLILTTGGTGLSKQDVTPEATKQVIEKELPGITQAMMIKNLQITDMAMLFRGVAGIKENSLIINLPGSTNAAVEYFGFIKSVIPHALDLILDRKTFQNTHTEIQEIIQADKIKQDSENSNESKVIIQPIAIRNKISSNEMIPFDKAFQIVCELSKNFNDVEEIAIEDSLGRVLACDIILNTSYPPFRISKVDGYAIRRQDGAGERKIKTALVGDNNTLTAVIEPREAVPVRTGTFVPNEADAVVSVYNTRMVETDKQGNETKISVNSTPNPGENISPIGSDILKYNIISKERETVTYSHMGMYATLGLSKVKVYKRARIGILSTGNDLCPFSTKNVPSGQMKDSTKLALFNLLKTFHYAASDLGIANDNPHLLKQALYKAFNYQDIVIITNGVSMGGYDVIKEVLKVDFEAGIHFEHVNIEPGWNTTFATCHLNGFRKLIFVLPGDLVSATVASRVFVIPALRTNECSKNKAYNCFDVQNEKPISNKSGKMEFRRMVLQEHENDDGKKIYLASDVDDQISSKLIGYALTQALVIVPHSTNSYNPYSAFQAIMLNH